MTHEEKRQWMAMWAAENELLLTFNGACGMGRECVGVLANEHYPDYRWYANEQDEESSDDNGYVWTPEDAYHKHPCVAVLGRGEDAESQLYEWLKWFDDNGFKLEKGLNTLSKDLSAIALLFGKHKFQRMVRTERKPTESKK